MRGAANKTPPALLPDIPWALQYLWDWYQELAETRQSGMAPNPITYQEIRAYSEQTLKGIDAWETKILRRIDEAVMSVWRQDQLAKEQERKAKMERESAKTENPDLGSQVAINDARGVNQLFSRLRAKKNAQFGSGGRK